MLPLPPPGAEPQALVESIRVLARDRFTGRAARYDAESSFPTENYADLRAADLLGLTIPAAYGGRGADSLTYALCLLEMAKGCSATALTFNMHAPRASSCTRRRLCATAATVRRPCSPSTSRSISPRRPPPW